MRLRTFDDGGRLLEGACRRYQRPMSVGFPTNRRDYIIFPGVFTSTRLRPFPTTGRRHYPLHFYTSTRPFLRRRGRRRYGCRCWRGRTPLATACAAHFVRGICRHYPLPSTHFPLPTSLYPLPTTLCPLPTAHYQLPTTIYHLPTTHYQLRAQMGGCQFTSE